MTYLIITQIIIFKFIKYFIQIRSTLSSKKKLIICHTDQIGDFIIFTNILSKIRNIFPQNEWNITLVGLEDWKELIEINVGSSATSWVDKFVSVSKVKFMANNDYRNNILKKLTDTSYNLVINTNTFRLLLSDLICFSIFSKNKISFYNNNNILHKFFNNFYSELIQSDKDFYHEINIYQKLFSKFNNYKFSNNNMFLDWNKSDEINIKKNGYINEPFILISTLSGNQRKDWPIENYINLISEIKKDYKILLCGNNDQKTLIDSYFKKNLDSKLINIAGKVSLREMVYLCKKSLMVISNDSMIGHMAVALNKPLICIIPGTDLISKKKIGNYFPYPDQKDIHLVINKDLPCIGCKWKCIYKIDLKDAFPCVSQISFDMIFLTYKKLIKIVT